VRLVPEGVAGMNAAEAVIASKLEALRQELGERIQAEQAYQEELAQHAYQRELNKQAQRDEFERLLREGKYPTGSTSMAGTGPLASVSGGYFKRLLDIDRLEAQVKLLQEVKATLDQQRAENRAHFVALEAGDRRPAKQNLWLLIAASVTSLILGWLLSIVGSPTTVLHMFGR
jgi:hypothetical protein